MGQKGEPILGKLIILRTGEIVVSTIMPEDVDPGEGFTVRIAFTVNQNPGVAEELDLILNYGSIPTDGTAETMPTVTTLTITLEEMLGEIPNAGFVDVVEFTIPAADVASNDHFIAVLYRSKFDTYSGTFQRHDHGTVLRSVPPAPTVV